MLFSLLKHYLDTDTALKVSQSVYCFTTSISHGVENYFPRLWGTGISDAIFLKDTLSIEDEKSVQGMQICLFVCLLESLQGRYPHQKCENFNSLSQFSH